MKSKLNIFNEDELKKISITNEIWLKSRHIKYLEFKREIDHSRSLTLYSVITVSKAGNQYLVSHLFKHKKNGDWEPVSLYCEKETDFTNHKFYKKTPTVKDIEIFKEKSLWYQEDGFEKVYHKETINELN